MRQRIFLCLAMVSGLTLAGLWGQAAPAPGELREWTDASGRKIVASLGGFADATHVILRLKNGQSVPYPIENLAPADRAFAQQAFARRGGGGEGGDTPEIDWDKPKQSERMVIRGLSREKPPGYIYTKVGWEYAIECVEAKVQFKGPEGSVPGYVRAYFYDRDGKLLQEFSAPPRRQELGGNYINPPAQYEKGKVVEAYFPVTSFLKESDWATALIVFGTTGECSVETFPKRSLKDLAFPEKAMAFPGWKPDGKPNQGGSPPTMAANAQPVTLEIRRFHQETHPKTILFDGTYQDGKPCVAAEVRAQGDISPGTGTVRLHAFDEANNRAVTRAFPSTVLIDASTYVGRPQIANDDWHPVFFGLDGDLKNKKFPTWVIVFQFAGQTVAEVMSSTNATLEQLDFPEKQAIAASAPKPATP